MKEKTILFTFTLLLIFLFSISIVTAGAEPICGNGILEINETCDDNNTIDNDGCSSLCQAEFVQINESYCGNSIIDYDEECDDGNTLDNDGCSSTCKIEYVESSGGVSPGNGTAPVIEILWILPDEDPNSTDMKSQINVVPGLERTDIYACFVASSETGRDSLRKGFVKVYHPDGSFKYQAHASQLDPVDDESDIRDCVAQALAAGIITEDDANAELPNQQGALYNVIEQDNWHMYKVYLPMFYHQPAGDYNVSAWITDQFSQISEAYTNNFEWVPGTYLDLDFDVVNFGSIEALSWKIANGDTDMETSEYPTLKNNGNTEISVAIMFSDFIGDNFGKIINDFDAQLRSKSSANTYNNITGEHLYASSNEIMNFSWPIELCRQEKIDFSIHADSGMIPDSYNGNITIFATGVDIYNYPKPIDSKGNVIVFDGFHDLNVLE